MGDQSQPRSKKGKYIYYHCTKYQRKCSQKAVTEPVLDQHLLKVLADLKISETGMEYVVAALKQSLSEKEQTHDVMYQNLMRERSRIKKRMKVMYRDKLDDKIAEDFYNEAFAEDTERLEQIEQDMKQHDQADINYYDFGLRILELAKNATKLYEAANPEERQELLHYLLSNSTLKNQTPDFNLNKPFDTIRQHASATDRKAVQALVDDFRTLDWFKNIPQNDTIPQYRHTAVWVGLKAQIKENNVIFWLISVTLLHTLDI